MYSIVDAELEKVQYFSLLILPTLYYLGSRNQSDLDVIQHQTTIGKLGELAVRRMIQSQGVNCSHVNLEVTTLKSWDADLIIAGRIRMHVKSQDVPSAIRFGLSWTFGIGDKNGNKGGHLDKEIFDSYTDTDMVAFCLVNEEDGWVGICAELPVYKLHDLNLFRDPKKKALIGIKKVVYFKDIPVEYRVY